MGDCTPEVDLKYEFEAPRFVDLDNDVVDEIELNWWFEQYHALHESPLTQEDNSLNSPSDGQLAPTAKPPDRPSYARETKSSANRRASVIPKQNTAINILRTQRVAGKENKHNSSIRLPSSPATPRANRALLSKESPTASPVPTTRVPLETTSTRIRITRGPRPSASSPLLRPSSASTFVAPLPQKPKSPLHTEPLLIPPPARTSMRSRNSVAGPNMQMSARQSTAANPPLKHTAPFTKPPTGVQRRRVSIAVAKASDTSPPATHCEVASAQTHTAAPPSLLPPVAMATTSSTPVITAADVAPADTASQRRRRRGTFTSADEFFKLTAAGKRLPL